MKQVVLTALIATLSLSGCGASTPSEKTGQSVMEAAVHRLGCMRLNSFRETDGQGYEFGGASFFRMEYAADIRIDDGCFGAYGNDDHKLWRFPKRFHTEEDDAILESMGYRLVKGGDVVRLIGHIDFKKQDGKWISRDHVF